MLLSESQNTVQNAAQHDVHQQHLTTIRDEFFSANTIVTTMQKLLVLQDSSVHDTIADTICTVIKNDLCPCVTDMGVSFFEASPILLLSYQTMHTSQLSAMKNYVLFLKDSGLYSASTQVGGGYRIMPLRNYRVKIQIDPALVIFACHVIIFQHLHSQSDTVNIINVILQRVTATVLVSQPRLYQANVLFDEFIELNKQTSITTNDQTKSPITKSQM